jgi:hypothetical protein
MFGVGWGTFYIFLKISCGPPLLTLGLPLAPPPPLKKASKQAFGPNLTRNCFLSVESDRFDDIL